MLRRRRRVQPPTEPKDPDAGVNARKKGTVTGLTLVNDVTGFYCGQMNGTLLACHGPDRIVVGGIGWQQYRGSVLIAWIEVAEGWKRQGIASALFHGLQSEFPHKVIEWGYTTPEGTALREALERRHSFTPHQFQAGGIAIVCSIRA